MVQNEETIVAEATPRGRGGIGIVRLSGAGTKAIAKQLLGFAPEAKQSHYCSFYDDKGEPIDQGIALFFKAPHSFTGEDVLELQAHGGPVIMDSLVQASIAAGARQAEPGEFSLRAFLNNKIDLVQAEAIADLINASTVNAAKGAQRSLTGAFSEVVNGIIQKLISLRMFVEAAIDFPEEEINFLSDERVLNSIDALLEELLLVRAKAEQGALLSEGIKLVIIGRPNAGKSSLLNVLSGYDRAIVSNTPGTTRDVLRETISLDGLLIELVDTAGLRVSEDAVEQEGILRALKETLTADHIVLLVDKSETDEEEPLILFPEWVEQFPKHAEITLVCNKADILNVAPSVKKRDHLTIVTLSVKTGAGINLLIDHLKERAGFSLATEGLFVARRRHLEALSQAHAHIETGKQQLVSFNAGELLAEELKMAQTALEGITGRFSSDDLLGKIFSEFCIGK